MKFGSPTIPSSNDIPEDQGWGRRLLALVKEVVDDLTSILSRGIHFNEHVYGGIITIPLTAGTYPIRFTPQTNKVAAVWVGKVAEQTGATAPSAAVWPDWEYVDGRVEISNLTGLTSGDKYNVTFLYVGG